MDDAACEFVSAKVVEVGGVGDVAFDSGIAARLEVHKSMLGALWTHGLKHDLRHGVQVDQRNIRVRRDLAGRLWIAAEGVEDVPIGVEAVAVLGGDNDRSRARLAHLGDEVGHDLDVVRHAVGNLLIVVRELHKEVIARLDQGHDLRKALLAQE